MWNGLHRARKLSHFRTSSVSRAANFASGAFRIRNLFNLCDGRGQMNRQIWIVLAIVLSLNVVFVTLLPGQSPLDQALKQRKTS